MLGTGFAQDFRIQASPPVVSGPHIQSGVCVPHGDSSSPGILLVDTTSLKPCAFNSEVLKILAYPADPGGLKHVNSFLAEVIKARLVRRNKKVLCFTSEFPSGKRKYQCRFFQLEKQLNGWSSPIALVFERHPSSDGALLQVAREFNLTPREQRTVQLLLGGLTSKEIAVQMNVSPNTVKTFLHLVMVKMGTSTRSGVLSKLFDHGTAGPTSP